MLSTEAEQLSLFLNNVGNDSRYRRVREGRGPKHTFTTVVKQHKHTHKKKQPTNCLILFTVVIFHRQKQQEKQLHFP